MFLTPRRSIRAALLLVLLLGPGSATLPASAASVWAPTAAIAIGPRSIDVAEQVRTLGRAFNFIHDQYVQPHDSAELLSAAWTRLVEEAGAAALPPPEESPEFGGGPTADLASFKAAFERYLAMPVEWPEGFVPVYAAIRGMVSFVDEPHTYFLEPRRYSEFNARLRGNQQYVGVGIVAPSNPDGLLVREVFEGSPAAEAGLHAGDLILAADGVTLSDVTPDERPALIRGPEGSSVELRIWRAVENAEIMLTVPRRQVTVPLFNTRTLEGNVGYLLLRNFPTRPRMVEVEQALDGLVTKGAASLILDLRGNGGGAVDGLEYLLDRAVPAGTPLYIINTRTQGEQKRFAYTGQAGKGFGVPLFVLVDQGSASAAEIFSAAVQEQRTGKVLGSRTAGAVAAASLFPLGDGSAISVTVQEVLTANGTRFNRVGLVPAEEMKTTPEMLARGEDPVLARALALARAPR